MMVRRTVADPQPQPSPGVYWIVLLEHISENATKANTEATLELWMENDDCRWALGELLDSSDG